MTTNYTHKGFTFGVELETAEISCEAAARALVHEGVAIGSLLRAARRAGLEVR